MTGKLTVLSSIMLNEYGFTSLPNQQDNTVTVIPCRGMMSTLSSAIIIPLDLWENIFNVFKSEYQLCNKHNRQRYIHKGCSTEFIKMIAKDQNRYPLIPLPN